MLYGDPSSNLQFCCLWAPFSQGIASAGRHGDSRSCHSLPHAVGQAWAWLPLPPPRGVSTLPTHLQKQGVSVAQTGEGTNGTDRAF